MIDNGHLNIKLWCRCLLDIFNATICFLKEAGRIELISIKTLVCWMCYYCFHCNQCKICFWMFSNNIYLSLASHVILCKRAHSIVFVIVIYPKIVHICDKVGHKVLDRGQMGDIRGSANTSLGGLHHPRSPVIIINLNVASTKIIIFSIFHRAFFRAKSVVGCVKSGFWDRNVELVWKDSRATNISRDKGINFHVVGL